VLTALLRRPLLVVSRSSAIKSAVTAMPVSGGIVARHVAGETTEDAVGTCVELVSDGLTVTVDHLGEDTLDLAQAEATVDAYVELLDAIVAADLASRVEVSVKLSAVGQALPGDGERIALENARRICQAATNAGTTVTLDMEDHTTTDSTLRVLADLRQDFPDTGAVLQSSLRRTEADCARLAHAGSRVRLCKGAYDQPDDVAYASRHEVDLSYVRCLRTLMAGDGYPMVATHDPRLVEIALDLAQRHGREPGDFEIQMLHGVRPDEQRRLVRLGHTVRVYLPYGREWYGYLVRRLAERPQNLAFFLRSLVSRG